MKFENVIVTGAAGFISYHLINRLLKAGVNVTGIDNFDPFYERSMKDQNIADLKVSNKKLTKMGGVAANLTFKCLDLLLRELPRWLAEI